MREIEQESLEAWRTRKEKLKKEGHHLNQTAKSREDLATTTGFGNVEIPTLDRGDAGWE